MVFRYPNNFPVRQLLQLCRRNSCSCSNNIVYKDNIHHNRLRQQGNGQENIPLCLYTNHHLTQNIKHCIQCNNTNNCIGKSWHRYVNIFKNKCYFLNTIPRNLPLSIICFLTMWWVEGWESARKKKATKHNNKSFIV